MKKETKFFLFAKNDHANEVFARYIDSSNFSERTGLWECDYPFANRAVRDKNLQHLDFEVFFRQGEGKLRPWRLDPRKKFTKSTKKILERLQRILDGKNAVPA
ncbi:MAG: hypothetical protein ABSF47_03095 [Minisyncoccia bacterium]